MSVRLALATLVATGCVAGEEMGMPDAGGSPTFTQGQARFAGEALAAGIEDTAQRFGPVAPQASNKPTPRAGLDPECVTLSGDQTDADGDSIPVSATLTFDCSKRRLGFTGILTGSETVADLQPAAIAWDFSASTTIHASLTGPFGGSAVVDTEGSMVASQGGLEGPYELASGLAVITLITNASGQETEVTEDVDLRVSFTPDLAWTPGGVVVRGRLFVDGAWSVSVGGVSGEATVATPTPLTLAPACESLITAGVVEAGFTLAGHTESISVRWSGCGQSAVTYDPEAAPAS
jgi:hypothetical protein